MQTVKFSRDRYNLEFERVNASWAYENNKLNSKEKEQVYQRLSTEGATPKTDHPIKHTGRSFMSSEYCYPGTNVLINKFDFKDQQTLDRAERYHTAYRAMELRFHPTSPTFGLDHLKQLHNHLFQDVYPFAGQIRTTNIGKSNFWFCDTTMIPRLADQVFSELKTDKYLKGLSKEAYAEKAAYYYTEINYMHPFREGNGRAIREFFGQMAKEAGYELDWQNVSKEEYFRAVKLTDDPKQRGELVEVFNKCLTPIVKKQQEVIQWQTPEQPMLLKDVLKITEKLPAAKANLSTEELNRSVDQFSIKENKTAIKVKFKGEQNIRNIPLEAHPYLSAERRNQMLDQAAQKTQQTQLNKFLEHGG